VLGDDSVFGFGSTAAGTGAAQPALPSSAPVRIRRAPLRALVRSCLARGHLGGAIFYADKLATLEQFAPSAVLFLAQAYARDGQHQRAVHLLRKHKLLQLPAGSLAQWRRQTLAHEEMLRKRVQARAARRNERLLNRQLSPSPQQSGGVEPTDAEAEDADPEELDPVTVRMECLYQGMQSLLEMQAHEEALRDCLPTDNGANESFMESPAEAAQWEAVLMRTLAAAAPAQSATASPSAPSSDPALRDQEVSSSVREVLGAEETALVLTLLKYRRLRREAARRARGVPERSVMEEAEEEDDGDEDEGNPIDLCASLCFLLGAVYESQSHRYRAVFWFQLCLRFDVRHLDAFERLTSKRLLTAREEQALFEQEQEQQQNSSSTAVVAKASSTSSVLRFPAQLEWLRLVWLNRVAVEQLDSFELQQAALRSGGAGPVSAKAVGSALGAPSSSSSVSPASSLLYRYRLLSVSYGLGSNLDLLSSVVAHRYAQGEYDACVALCELVQQADPFLLAIMPTFLACLVQLGLKQRLFFVAHRLVAAYPRRAVSWHAVGCYYLLLDALEVARRFFHKATRLDPLCAQAWIGFGHTFSYQDESEQALLSYRTAHRLFEGSHVPLLCMGQEYLRTNHLVLARHFLLRARQASPDDPLPHHELGVLEYKSNDLPAAVEHFVAALARVKHQALHHWEATMFNLGHAYRKMRRYPEAISAYNRALSVSTGSGGGVGSGSAGGNGGGRAFSLLCALGFTYHLTGALEEAVSYYHQALGLRPRDAFATDMLDRALGEMANQELRGTESTEAMGQDDS